MSRARREDIAGLKRGSRARRHRQWDRIEYDARHLPRWLMAHHRRKRRGFLFWAPLPAPGEKPPEWPTLGLEWISLGYTDDGFSVSETLRPARGPSLDYVIVDELDAFRRDVP